MHSHVRFCYSVEECSLFVIKWEEWVDGGMCRVGDDDDTKL